MGIEVLLELPVSMCPERLAVGDLNFERLGRAAAGGATLLGETGAGTVAYVGVNGPAFSVAVFASALAGLPICPVNYRLPDAELGALLDRLDRPLVLVDADMRHRVGDRPRLLDARDWLVAAETAEPAEPAELADDAVAVILFTSGTTAAPKAVLLRHEHLTAYVLQTVELMGADEDACALVAVPPYHVAGVATVLSNAYSGRRVVHLAQFTAESWVELVAGQGVTSAMVVPTMLARIADHLEASPRELPRLASVAYGGARISPAVLARALALLPNAGFTNAYGLTETSSTIAVLSPEDHRAALAGDEAARGRLASAGLPVPGIELEIRNAEGRPLPAGESGLLFVRGPQVSGEYDGIGSALDANGWFPTKDRAHLDADGYLFLEGRDDDTIIRGGENIAPAEVEDVLLAHPVVLDAAVVGLPDEEWGQRIAAVVVVHPTRRGELGVDDTAVTAALLAHARAALRSSRAPDSIIIWPELPYNPTGKLMRRDVVAALTTGESS